MRSGIATIVLVGLAIATFAYGQTVSYGPTVGSGTSIPFRIVSQSNASYQSSPLQLVINGQVLWSVTWTRATCITGYACPVPQVDFGNTTLLAVFAGPELYINYVVNVTEVRQDGSGLFVATTLWVPGPGCPIPIGAHSGSPYQIVAIAKTSLPVTFSNRTYIINC